MLRTCSAWTHPSFGTRTPKFCTDPSHLQHKKPQILHGPLNHDARGYQGLLSAVLEMPKAFDIRSTSLDSRLYLQQDLAGKRRIINE